MDKWLITLTMEQGYPETIVHLWDSKKDCLSDDTLRIKGKSEWQRFLNDVRNAGDVWGWEEE